jgi:hypothetical protein
MRNEFMFEVKNLCIHGTGISFKESEQGKEVS